MSRERAQGLFHDSFGPRMGAFIGYMADVSRPHRGLVITDDNNRC